MEVVDGPDALIRGLCEPANALGDDAVEAVFPRNGKQGAELAPLTSIVIPVDLDNLGTGDAADELGHIALFFFRDVSALVNGDAFHFIFLLWCVLDAGLLSWA